MTLTRGAVWPSVNPRVPRALAPGVGARGFVRDRRIIMRRSHMLAPYHGARAESAFGAELTGR
jgi:hypothetical protein